MTSRAAKPAKAMKPLLDRPQLPCAVGTSTTGGSDGIFDPRLLAPRCNEFFPRTHFRHSRRANHWRTVASDHFDRCGSESESDARWVAVLRLSSPSSAT